LGFHQGGHAGYGLRRQLVDLDGKAKELLRLGQWKSLHSDKVILVPGPQHELDIVAGIYRSFIDDGMTETEIRNDLNARDIKTAYDKAWMLYDVHKVLSSPKYTGVNIFNRQSFKLGQKRVRNPPELWIRRTGAFKAIVSTEDFQKAQALIAARSRKWDNEALLDKLRDLLKTSGRLTADIIDAAPAMPSSVTYSNRFGGLGQAYTLAGWRFDRDLTFVVDRKRYKGIRQTLLQPTLKNIVDSGRTYRYLDRFGLLSINDDFTVCTRIVRSIKRQCGRVWKVVLGRCRQPVEDFVRRKELYVEIIARLPSEGVALLDTDVPEHIERATRELLDTALRQFSLKQLQEIQDVLADVKKQCTPAGRALTEIASAFDIRASFSVRCLIDLINARELLQKAPFSILYLRDKKFEQEGLLSLLALASSESEELRRRRDAAAKHFVVDSTSSANELEDAASVIESTSWLTQWFSSGYKQAVLLFVSHCHQPHKAKRHKMATSLKTIAQCKGKLARFANRDDLKLQLGTDFRGIDTAWDDLMNLAGWYEELLVRLPEHQEFTSKLRSALFGLPAARLKGILTAEPSDLPKAENLKTLLASLEDLHALLPHVAFERSDEPVDVFLASADHTATKGEMMLDAVRHLGLSSETDSTSLLQIVASTRSAKTLRSSITGDRTIREMLGNAYDGIATETRRLKLTLSFIREIQGSRIPKELKGWLLNSEFEKREAWLQDWAKQFEANSRSLTSLEREVVKSVGTESILAKDSSVPALNTAVGVLDKCLAGASLRIFNSHCPEVMV
jgi:hypothetical protein